MHNVCVVCHQCYLGTCPVTNPPTDTMQLAYLLTLFDVGCRLQNRLITHNTIIRIWKLWVACVYLLTGHSTSGFHSSLQ
jgi:hypothetical protein